MEGILAGTDDAPDFVASSSQPANVDDGFTREQRKAEKRKRKAEKAARKEKRRKKHEKGKNLAKEKEDGAPNTPDAMERVLVGASPDAAAKEGHAEEEDAATEEVDKDLVEKPASADKKKKKRKRGEGPATETDEPARSGERHSTLPPSTSAAQSSPAKHTHAKQKRKNVVNEAPPNTEASSSQAPAFSSDLTARPPRPRPSTSTSTPRPKKPSATVTADPSPFASGSRKKGTMSQIEEDEELRRAFRGGKGAMDAWLASKWIPVKELQRLEAAGIMTYKRGMFSEAEKATLRDQLMQFKQVHRLSDEELVGIIMAKGRVSVRTEFPKFWPELAASTPGRPVVYVKRAVQRMYDPRGRKGAWTKDEDDELERAYAVHPDQWAKIAEVVDRTEQDCRDRWKNELVSRQTRVEGHWTDEEKDKLISIVQSTNRSLGQDPNGSEAPWDVVSERMGGTRSRQQCRKKWQDQLRVIVLRGEAGGPSSFPRDHKAELVQRLRDLDVTTEADVDWTTLWPGFSAGSLRQVFSRLKAKVPNKGKSFSQILDDLAAYLSSKAAASEDDRTPSRKGREGVLNISSHAMIMSSDESGDEPDEDGAADEDEKE